VQKQTAHSEPAKCRRCGRIYRHEPGRVLCHHCTGESEIVQNLQPSDEEKVVPLAERRYEALMAVYNAQAEGVHAGLIPPVDASLAHPAIAAEPVFDQDRECTLCEKPPLKGSDFCLGCQTRLHKDFGDAAHTLFTELESVEESKPGSIRTVMSALSSARARSPHTRINPVAMGKLKT
jgi:hypothetical protein